MLAIALLVILVALLTGPYPWAVRMRTWVRDLFAALVSAAKGADRTAAATWVTLHRDALLMAGAAVAVLALLLLGGGWGSLLLILIVGGLYALVVWRIAESASADPEPDTAAPEA
jgi:fatty acid desaturase